MSKQNNQGGTPGKNNPADEEKNQAAKPENPDISAEKTAEKPAEEKNDNAASADAANQKPGQEKIPTAQEKIAELEIQLAEANDNFLRKAADFENFRKRMNREKQEAIEYANQSLLLDLIEIVDDFERAIKSAESLATGEFKAFYEGISMIEKRFTTLLENKWGLKRFSSAGAAFDPNIHEAVMMEKSAGITEPMVAEEYYKGYTLKDRIVRHAKVKVAMPEKPAQGADESKPGTGE